MTLSNTTEYALRILIYMNRTPGQLVTARQLIDRLQISDKYLRRLMTVLTKKGFITSIQGREGGYLLARNADEVHLMEIIDAIEGMDRFQGCFLGLDACNDATPCALHESLGKVRKAFLKILAEKTLADLNDPCLIKL
jgi:Rrf2 family protein